MKATFSKRNFLYILFFILSLYTSVNSKEKEEITSVEQLKDFFNSADFYSLKENPQNLDDPVLYGLNDGNECLMSEAEAKKVLQESYGVTDSSPDENMRFILGKCYPVLLVPGVYATKLYAELNCKGMAEKERYTTLRDLRVFCGDLVCQDESKTSEEHPLLIAVIDQAFSIRDTKENPYSTCLAHIMNYFQNENECPENDGKKMCYKSDFIKVGYYGGTATTESKGQCGLEAIQNVIQSGFDQLDDIVNQGAAKSYNRTIKSLKDRGYSSGFSLGGLPNDYRRFLSTNNFATKVFRSQINRLYANTGKPVVVIGHSYGTLVSFTNLVKLGNSDLLPKIRKFIAVAPPFAGSSKLIDEFLHGMEDWNKRYEFFGFPFVTNYNKFGQFMMYKSMPTLIELRPLSIAGRIFTESKYSRLGNAIRERIALEKTCSNKDCSASEIKEKSTLFDGIFKGYFPSLTEEECAFESLEGTNPNTFNRKCYTEIYNVGDCPTILAKSSSFDPSINNVESYCNKTGNQYYYQNKCDGDKQCLDKMYYTKAPYVYDNTEALNFLIDRFNTNFAPEFDGKKIDKSYFDSYQHIKDGLKKMIDYNDQISITKELPAPPVDTDLVYTSFVKTPEAFILDESDFTKEGQTYKKGGDGTVPTWSSLLTGLKWIYEKKVYNLPKKYKLVEYCSRLSTSEKYKLIPEKEQDFIALGCSCLNPKNQYNDTVNDCYHAEMLNDDSFIKYVISVVDDPKVVNTVTTAKKTAVKNYDKNKAYEDLCNGDLFNILDTGK